MDVTNNGKTKYKKYELIAETLSLEDRSKMTSHSSHEEMVNYLLSLWSDVLVQKLSDDDLDKEFALLGGNSQHLAILEAKINITLSLAKEYEIYIGAEDDKLSPTMTIDTLASALVKKVELSRQTQEGRQLQQSLRRAHQMCAACSFLDPLKRLDATQTYKSFTLYAESLILFSFIR